MIHPLVTQLRFARNEFVRCLEGISEEDARQRLLPMNSISWTVGHLAAQEQDYFVFFASGKGPHPRLNELVGFGRPASTPPLSEMWQAWHDITSVADTFLDTLSAEQLQSHLEQSTSALADYLMGIPSKELLAQPSVRSWESVGTRILRTTYHYLFHTGEAHAIRQQLGHPDLPFFIGNMPDDLFLG